jgi:type II secretory pathway component PulK
MFIRASTNRTGPEPRRGVVLLAVLVVVTLLTLAAYQYSEMMLSEYKAADAYTRSAQARAAAESGIQYAAALLSSSDAMQNTLNGNPWYNPSAFQGILVRDSDKDRLRCRVSIVALLNPDLTSGGGVTAANQGYWFGVMDEGSKINLQSLMKLDSSGQTAYNVLIKLPNMTDDVANSILDWIDPSSTQPRSSGAKDTYYTALSPPYHCKNGPLDSMEELLLVKGIAGSPQLLFGNDRNRNGILDPDENDGSGQVDRGWSAYLTIYTRELNVDSTGNPRIFLNDSDLQTLYNNLQSAVGDDLANYILAYRQYGAASGTSGGGPGGAGGGQGGAGGGGANQGAAGGGNRGNAGGAAAGGQAGGAGAGAAGAGAGGARAGGGGGQARLSRNQINFQGGNQARSISSLYELINSSVSIPATDQNGQPVPNGQPTIYPSPMSDPSSIRQLFPTLYDKATTQTNGEIPGRVNVNTAPSAVLSALPGFSDNDVQAILANRPDPSTATQAPDAIFQTPAWLLTEANISANTLRTVDRYITTTAQVYRVQAVGYFDGGGPTVRIEAVIDTNAGRPRIVYWRDLTELGKGFDFTGN